MIFFEKVNMKFCFFLDYENKNLFMDKLDLFLYWSEKY